MSTRHLSKLSVSLSTLIVALSLGAPLHAMADGQANAQQLLARHAYSGSAVRAPSVASTASERAPHDAHVDARMLLSTPGTFTQPGPVFEGRSSEKDAHARAVCLLRGKGA